MRDDERSGRTDRGDRDRSDRGDRDRERRRWVKYACIFYYLGNWIGFMINSGWLFLYPLFIFL